MGTNEKLVAREVRLEPDPWLRERERERELQAPLFVA
jgi:hypothetical protein